MVRTISRLRLRSSWNRWRQSSVGQKFLTAITVATTLWAAAVAGFVLAAARFTDTPGAGHLRLVIILGTTLALWLVPVITQFFDPSDVPIERFELFPLRDGQKIAGLLAARLVSLPGMGGALILVGTILGYAPRNPGALLTTVLALTFLMVCVITCRSVSGLLEGLQGSRRGRELALLLVSMLSLAFWPLTSGLSVTVDSAGIGDQLSHPLVRWSPPGALAGALVDVRDGSYGSVPGAFGVAGVTMAGALAGWAVVLRRAPTGGGRETRARSRRRARPGLIPPILGWLPRDRRGAVVAAELRAFVRQPALLYPFVWASLYPVFIGGPYLIFESTATATVLGAYVAWFLGLSVAAGIFHADAPALWQHAVAAGRMADSVYGKVVARALVVGLLVGTVLAVGSVLHGSIEPLLVGGALAAGTYAIAGGLGAVQALYQPSKESQKGCAPTGLLMMVLELVLIAPGAIAVGVGYWSSGWLWPWCVGAAAYGLVVGAIVVRTAGRRADERLLEVVERAAKEAAPA